MRLLERRTLLMTLAMVVIAIASMLPVAAFADSANTLPPEDALETQADELSSEYALLKSDGWLYRADSNGNALDYGTLWYGPSEMPNIKTLFVDSDVRQLVDDDYDWDYAYNHACGRFRYSSGGKLWEEKVSFTGRYGTYNLSGLESVYFKLDENGVNACSYIVAGSFMYSPLKSVTNLERTRVTELNSSVFYDCENLNSINLSGLREVGSQAFANCSALKSASMPNVISVGDEAFLESSGLENAELPVCESIGSRAFEGCSSLKSIDLGSYLKEIGSGSYGAFFDCASLETISFPGTLQSLPCFGDMLGRSGIKTVVLRSPVFVSMQSGQGWWAPSASDIEILVPATLYGEYSKNEPSHNPWYEYRESFRPMADIAEASINLEGPPYPLVGGMVQPSVSVTYENKLLREGVDYVVRYSSNDIFGMGIASIYGIGNYAGGQSVVFVTTPDVVDADFMHRLYNQWSGEHFYTADDAEFAGLVALGWTDEGMGWTAPKKSGTPVFRLYNPYAGEHHYTMDAEERGLMIEAGWIYEGVGWYSDDAQAVPLYREYNPFAPANNHNYTTDQVEHAYLVSIGWRNEGIAWYGI